MPGAVPLLPKFQFSNNGAPMVNGTVAVYLAGTVTPSNTWQDEALTILNTNPIVLDARGEAVIYLDPALSYKFLLKNSGGVTQWTQDDINGGATAAEVAAALVAVGTLRTDLAASSGSTLIGWLRSAASAVVTTIAKWMGWQPYSVFDFMTDAQQADVRAYAYGLDATASINAAITATGANRKLIWPAGGYKQTAQLTQLAGQKWEGEGGQRATTIKKYFNGDMLVMGDLAGVSDLNFDGNGATYTGKGIAVTGGFSQEIRRVRIANTAATGLHFAADAGRGAVVSAVEIATINPETVFAIALAGDTGAAPRFFDQIWLSGGTFDASGCNDCFISNAYVKRINTSATSAQLNVSNTRYALSGAAHTIQGTNGNYVNCAFAGAITINNSQGLKFVNADFGFGVTEDAATCSYNEITHQLYSYTPTWTQASGIQPAIGNGSITGFYTRTGNLCTVSVRVVFGSTTTYGNGDTGYVFSLPYRGHQALNQRGLFATIYAVSTALDYSPKATIPLNEAIFTLGLNGAGVRDGFPAVWSAGSAFDIQFSYLVK